MIFKQLLIIMNTEKEKIFSGKEYAQFKQGWTNFFLGTLLFGRKLNCAPDRAHKKKGPQKPKYLS